MNQNEIKKVRLSLGLTLAELGKMLGYKGAQLRQQMWSIEDGRKPLRPCQERLLMAYVSGYRPVDWPVK